MKNKKILALASEGGHWIELLRLKIVFEQATVIYVSTSSEYGEILVGSVYYNIVDASRWNPLKLLPSFIGIFKILFKERPDYLITTGAAPGLMGVLASKFFNCKSIWIDTIAHVNQLSMSGKIALNFADVFFTQWEHLSTNKVIYKGNVLL